MFCFYVCNNDHRRRESEEGSVILICFHNDDIPFTHDGICLVKTVNPAAYNDGGIKVPGLYNMAGHGSGGSFAMGRSEEHTSELQSRGHLVCRLLLDKKHQ